MYNVHYTLYNVQHCTMYNIVKCTYRTMYNILQCCTLYNVEKCTMYNVHFVHCTMLDIVQKRRFEDANLWLEKYIIL